MLTQTVIRRCLSQHEQPPRCSDYDLNSSTNFKHSNQSLQLAAVLLPLVHRGDDFYLILTQRTEHLHHHPGQICFPGGRYDTLDQTVIQTALRETQEEIGLSAEFIEIGGYLDSYETMTGFLIVPLIGFIRPGFQLVLDSFEVADAFEVPLSFILNSANYSKSSVQYHGQAHFYYVLNYQNRVIWGATAGILMNLCRRLQQPLTTQPPATITSVIA